MNSSKTKTNNPPLPSPWASRAPKGLRENAKKLSQLPHLHGNLSNAASQDIINLRVQRQRSVLKENAVFRHLNKNTLLLSFPEVHPDQIDAALTLCDNDLSETISLLQLRVRILRSRKLQMEKRNACKYVSILRKKNSPPKMVKYIPTKYNDVHIVEVPNHNVNNHQIKVMEVNNNVLQMLETCQTTMLLPQNILSESNNVPPMTTHTVTSLTSNSCASSAPEFSPTTTNTSSVHSGDSNNLKVYDFAEDEPVKYHLPKPSRKPLDKVGIVLKKGRFGLSVRLL